MAYFFSLLLCFLTFFTGCPDLHAASETKPAFRYMKIHQAEKWEQGIFLSLPINEKICRSKYGEQWTRGCSITIGENGEPIEGISLSPSVPGKWRWEGSMAMRFYPEKPLSPSTRYTVDISEMKLPTSLSLPHKSISFSSRPQAVNLSKWKLWIDPSEKKAHVWTGTLNFTYPTSKFMDDNISTGVFNSASGLALGNCRRIWNFDRTSVNLTVPVLNLPSSSPEMYVQIMNTRTFTYQNGKFSFPKDGSDQGGIRYIMTLPSSPLSIENISAELVNSENMDKVCELSMNATMHINSEEFLKKALVVELPLHNTKGASRPFDWTMIPNITPDILNKGRKIALHPMQSSDASSEKLKYRFEADPNKCLYVYVPAGLKSTSGYETKREWKAVLRINKTDGELRFLQSGNILPLAGEKKIDIYSMGIDTIEWKAHRVLRPFLALLSDPYSTFSEPLNNGILSFDQISVISSGTLIVPQQKSMKANFSVLDLSKILSDKGENTIRGLMEITLIGKKKGKEIAQERKFVLITDLGILAKKSSTGEYDIFVSSLISGEPQENITVSALGKNGIAVATAQTDKEGHAVLPSLNGLKAEHTPVSIVAVRDMSQNGCGSDLAWVSLLDETRKVDYSAFPSQGVVSGANAITAFAFAQRGMFRPGEVLHFGAILRNAKWESIPSTMPFYAELTDPAGRAVFSKNFTVGADGMTLFDWQSAVTSLTGKYTLDIKSGGKYGSVLGTVTTRVEEFQPDTMRMESNIIPDKKKGWVNATDEPFAARVSVSNLFGTPGQNRRVKAHLSVFPAEMTTFPEYPQYIFYNSEPSKGTTEKDLPEMTTDDDGKAQFLLPADIGKSGTVRCIVNFEGFEPNGGRSVHSSSNILISPMKTNIGYKLGGTVPNLGFIPQDRDADLEFIAISSGLERTAMSNLTFTVSERREVKTLVSDSRGVFRYDQTPVDKPLSSTSFNIDATKPLRWKIPTHTPGEYILTVRDKEKKLVASVPFTVTGNRLMKESELTVSSLRIRTEKDSYNPGDTIHISVAVPYDGAGLITIERDGVIAHKWFSAKAGESMQSIDIPKNFEGTGYINVSFARALESADIYMRPYAYAAVPFFVGMEKRDMALQISSPKKALPGAKITVNLKSKAKGKAVIFAVDEGILQLTRFKTPSPLDALLKNRALGVSTRQAFDLLMPDHGIMKLRMPGFGGGEEAFASLAKMQNPFKRRGEDPVVTWSGIVEVTPEGKDITIDIPDCYNGSLRIMAVASSKEFSGSACTDTVIRGDIIITPQIPVMVSPGDIFEGAIGISNQQIGSGKKSLIRLTIKSDGAVAIEGDKNPTIKADENGETLYTFRAKVKDIPGESKITITAEGIGGKTVQRVASVSIRPASPLIASITAGKSNGTLQILGDRELYPMQAKRSITVSRLPLPAIHGLLNYLDSWPHGCTEQLISRAFPYVVMRNHPEYMVTASKNAKAIQKQGDKIIQAALQAISLNRDGTGLVSIWQFGKGSAFLTTYAADLLITMREHGLTPPLQLVDNLCNMLEYFAGTTASSDEDARTKAYAIWVLCREGRIMTQAIELLDQYIEENPTNMKDDIAAVFSAGAKAILHIPTEKPEEPEIRQLSSQSWFDSLSVQGFYAAVQAEQFKKRGSIEKSLLESALTALKGHGYSTFSSAQVIRALVDISDKKALDPAKISVSCVEGESSKASARKNIPFLSLEAPMCTVFQVENPEESTVYWQLTSEGYDKNPPVKAESRGMEISRTLLNAEGKAVKSVEQGEVITVQIKAKAYGKTVENTVITDLLPGGFEMLIPNGGGKNILPQNIVHQDRREDRMILFANIGDNFTFSYKIKAVNKGVFTLPPISASAMYDLGINAHSAVSSIEIR